MPCFYPLQGISFVDSRGVKVFKLSQKYISIERNNPSARFLAVPCGRCMGCRLEKARQWALRCVHESKCHEENCFLTLTFSDEGLRKEAPDRSIRKHHMQNFLKRLRQRYDDRRIRFFGCGEYGDRLGRPHYHLAIFGFEFPEKDEFGEADRYFRFCDRGNNYYGSRSLNELWPHGDCVMSALTFESAAYVARYVTKKMTGDQAKKHYKGREPEFCLMSLKPGIGFDWFERFGRTDVLPFDECVARGHKCKPPRYYDKLLQRLDPAAFDELKVRRRKAAEEKAQDNTPERLSVKERCVESSMRQLVRKLEARYV